MFLCKSDECYQLLWTRCTVTECLIAQQTNHSAARLANSVCPRFAPVKQSQLVSLPPKVGFIFMVKSAL